MPRFRHPARRDGGFAAAARPQRALTMIGLQARRVIAPLGRAVTAWPARLHGASAPRHDRSRHRAWAAGAVGLRPAWSAQLPHGLARAAPVRKLLELMSAERSGHGY